MHEPNIRLMHRHAINLHTSFAILLFVANFVIFSYYPPLQDIHV